MGLPNSKYGLKYDDTSQGNKIDATKDDEVITVMIILTIVLE